MKYLKTILLTLLFTLFSVVCFAGDLEDKLLLAVQTNNFSDVKKYIKKGADVNSRNFLVFATNPENDLEIIKILIEAKADVNKPDEQGRTPLISAARNNNIEAFKLILTANANVNSQDNAGNTALIEAIDTNNIEMVKLLISSNADLNIINKNGVFALLAATNSNKIEIVELLLNAKANPNTVSDLGTALIMASSKNNIEIVKLLLAAKADVTLKDRYGQTALFRTSSRGNNDEIAKLLKKAGAKK